MTRGPTGVQRPKVSRQGCLRGRQGARSLQEPGRDGRAAFTEGGSLHGGDLGEARSPSEAQRFDPRQPRFPGLGGVLRNGDLLLIPFRRLQGGGRMGVKIKLSGRGGGHVDRPPPLRAEPSDIREPLYPGQCGTPTPLRGYWDSIKCLLNAYMKLFRRRF